MTTLRGHPTVHERQNTKPERTLTLIGDPVGVPWPLLGRVRAIARYELEIFGQARNSITARRTLKHQSMASIKIVNAVLETLTTRLRRRFDRAANSSVVASGVCRFVLFRQPSSCRKK
jgi:hypothetical protein